MHPMLNTAVKAARKAGAIINRASLDLDQLTVRSKQDRDYVTEVDQMAERAVIETLLDAYPNHGILAEESGTADARNGEDYQWIIDPLDGAHQLPPRLAAIFRFHRTQAQGPDHPGRRIRPRTQRTVHCQPRPRRHAQRPPHPRQQAQQTERVPDRHQLPYTDFSYAEAYLNMFRDMMRATSGLRRPGSAALDLCYVACGRYDGFWEMHLKPWDLAAGSLIAQEAGALVGNFMGDEGFLESGNIVAASPKIFGQMLQVLAPHLPPELKV